MPVTWKAVTGSVRPLTSTEPSGSSRTYPATSRAVASLTTIVPGWASC